jgi:vacuolar-type H+-ATPase subunit F/Vma7
MSAVVAVGEARRLTGFALAGVDVRGAEDASAANVVFDELDGEIGLLVLTPRSETALRARLAEREDLVWVTLPD